MVQFTLKKGKTGQYGCVKLAKGGRSLSSKIIRLISMTVDEIDVAANFLMETYSADLDNDLATELNISRRRNANFELIVE